MRACERALGRPIARALAGEFSGELIAIGRGECPAGEIRRYGT